MEFNTNNTDVHNTVLQTPVDTVLKRLDNGKIVVDKKTEKVKDIFLAHRVGICLKNNVPLPSVYVYVEKGKFKTLYGGEILIAIKKWAEGMEQDNQEIPTRVMNSFVNIIVLKFVDDDYNIDEDLKDDIGKVLNYINFNTSEDVRKIDSEFMEILKNNIEKFVDNHLMVYMDEYINLIHQSEDVIKNTITNEIKEGPLLDNNVKIFENDYLGRELNEREKTILRTQFISKTLDRVLKYFE